MTLEETRQLGIEFERRIQTMIPSKEYLDKMDTETIYAYLNQYQDKYITDIFNNIDNVPSGSKIHARVSSILQALLNTQIINVEGAIRNTQSNRSFTYLLDPKFCMYVKSVSNVYSTYRYKNERADEISSLKVLPNTLVSLKDLQDIIETPNDDMRILRNPIAALTEYVEDKPTLTVLYDRYTNPKGIKVTYYRSPRHFDIMTSTSCELPIEVFDDLVNGAIQLYLQYASGQLNQNAEKENKKED